MERITTIDCENFNIISYKLDNITGIYIYNIVKTVKKISLSVLISENYKWT